MTRKLFGTDGVRGTAGVEPMTPETILKLAQSAGVFFNQGPHRHLVVIGKDTRLSGYLIEPALVSGFVSVGIDVILVGPLPTPAVAMLTRSLRADLGVMISASHNPFEDNGIKFFGKDGRKLSDKDELAIESLMETKIPLASHHRLGHAKRMEDASGRYIEYLKSNFPKHLRLDGFKIVIDCAHGAAYKVAEPTLWELGAEVISIGVDPNGTNINDSVGATSPKALQEAVVAHQAHLGLALDGDADRLIIVDEKGTIVDGDQIMALIATHWARQGRLNRNTLVATVMSNLALKLYLETQGIHLHQAQVGDRYVSAVMQQEGYNVGGEQSGHLILSDYSTTGDGLVAALQVLEILVTHPQPASQAFHLFEPYPQKLINLPLPHKKILDSPEIAHAIQHAQDRLKDGRLLVRPSGTEPLVRLMGEAPDKEFLAEVLSELADTFRAHVNA